MEILFKYYGLDWLAMLMSLLAVYLLGNKNRFGFLSFVLANFTWLVLGVFWMQSYGIAIGNFVFLIMNMRGFFAWNIKTEQK